MILSLKRRKNDEIEKLIQYCISKNSAEIFPKQTFYWKNGFLNLVSGAHHFLKLKKTLFN